MEKHKYLRRNNKKSDEKVYSDYEQTRMSYRPAIRGRKHMVVTGHNLVTQAAMRILDKGGNAIDASCAMLASTCTMWDVLSWGGETQALIYNPKTKKVIAINALGVAPTGATVDFYKSKGYAYPPEYGPLAAVTPGTPGGLLTMLAEYGTMSLKEVLAPAMSLAEGYPIEAQTANSIERAKQILNNGHILKKCFCRIWDRREKHQSRERFLCRMSYSRLWKNLFIPSKKL